MEQSGRNQWQSVANETGPKTAQSGKPLPWVATSCRDPKMVRMHSLQEREGVTSLAPQEAPSPANPKAHRT